MNKYFSNILNLKARVLFIIFVFIININSNVFYPKADDLRTVKVGYPIVSGFTELNDGFYSGYAFEYLLEISKYTGWNYEFIETDLSSALNMLNNGEIDILAGMIKNEATSEIFDFPELSSGNTYSTLSTLNTNDNISRSDLSTFNGIRVGYFDKNSALLEKLTEFFNSNNISDFSYISYSSKDSDALSNALKNNEVDAIITGDLLLNSDFKVLTKFNSKPYYFATTKGNSYITKQLDYAINKINEYEPYFTSDLYHKYFEDQVDKSILLNEKELNYLSNIKTLKAVYVDNFKPIQYYDEKEDKAKGIVLDVFDILCKKLNINYELIKADSYSEAYKLITENPNYIAIALPFNYENALDKSLVFTKSFMDLSIVKVYSKKSFSNTDNDNKILALPVGYEYSDLNEDYTIKYYETLEECLDAVENNKAYFTYGNYYSISNYLNEKYYSNLSIVTDNLSNSKASGSMALSSQSDKILFDILNKVLLSIDSDDVKTAIYDNTIDSNTNISLKKFFMNNTALCLSALGFILFIIFILLYTIVINKIDNLKQTKEILLNKSERDPLTELYNRVTAKDLISSYFENYNNAFYSFIIFDIDHFKDVNDNLGHIFGDKILIEFSNLLKNTFSSSDVLCRLGGDEFIVFMKDLDSTNYSNILEEKLKYLCNSMNKTLNHNNQSQNLSISVGATISNKKLSFDDLYVNSDKLLYKVKRDGRNGFKINNL